MIFFKIQLIFDIKNWFDFDTFWRTVIINGFKKNPLSMLILGQKSCFLGPIIFKIPQLTLLNRWCTVQSQLMPNLNTLPLVSFSQKVWWMKIDANHASIIFGLCTSPIELGKICSALMSCFLKNWIYLIQL